MTRKTHLLAKRRPTKPVTASRDLAVVEEPQLGFAYGQTADHPRDGLYLYGPPVKEGSLLPVDYGVIGTEAGVER